MRSRTELQEPPEVVRGARAPSARADELLSSLRWEPSLRFEPLSDHEGVTLREMLVYHGEKLLSLSGGAYYYILFASHLALCVILGLLWHLDSSGSLSSPALESLERRLVAGKTGRNAEDSDMKATNGVMKCLFIAFQVILSAGHDEEIDTALGMFVYGTMLLVGFVMLSSLISMITDSFKSLLAHIRSGQLRAEERGHTVLLGWNEGTVRLICQIAFLRKAFHELNRSGSRRLFWWRRFEASTSLANCVVVVMCDNLRKDEMEQAIAHGLAERGISSKCMRLGCDLICRVGDPSDIQSLQRVCVQHAHAIVIQETDGVELDTSEGMAMRTLMALRYTLYMCCKQPAWDNLRIVVGMSQPSQVVKAATFAGPDQGAVVYQEDLSVYLNSLLFACLGQPGLVQAQLELLSFERAAIRLRKASDLRVHGCSVSMATLLWEDAVLVGVQPFRESACPCPPRCHRCQSGWLKSGLLPHPGYVIRPDDTVLFLCERSMPTRARPVEWARPRLSTDSDDKVWRSSSNDPSRELRVLVCGWRSAWDQADSLLQVLEDIAHDGQSSMLLHFVCSVRENAFRGLMKAMQRSGGEVEATCAEPQQGKPAWRVRKRCDVAHTYWDCEHFEGLEQIVKEQEYHEAIIIPPATLKAGSDPLTKDNWVMSLMLMLRQFQCESHQKPMHVITETTIDATSKLAVAPSRNKDGLTISPEFVNTVAIKARVLAQVAAYPQMSSVLNDLYSPEMGSPILMVMDARTFCLQGRKLTFREATQVVHYLQPNDDTAIDVVLGVRAASGKLRMPPKQSEVHDYEDGDSLVLITRRAATPTQYEELIRWQAERFRLPKKS